MDYKERAMTIFNYSMERTCEFRSDSNLYVRQVYVDFGVILEKKKKKKKMTICIFFLWDWTRSYMRQ